MDPKTLWTLIWLHVAWLCCTVNTESHFLPYLLFVKRHPDRSLSACMCQVLDPKDLPKLHC